MTGLLRSAENCLRTSEGHGVVIAEYLDCDHRGVLRTELGLIFPGMIEEPGSFSGSLSSPKPARGPQAYQRTSFPIFISAPASVRSAPLALQAVVCRERCKLLGAETKG